MYLYRDNYVKLIFTFLLFTCCLLIFHGCGEKIDTLISFADESYCANKMNEVWHKAYGEGNENNPYLICTARQLQNIGNSSEDWGHSYKLMGDIDLSEYNQDNFTIIGNSTTNFTGTFDGNGYTISNFSYTYAAYNLGFIGYLAGSSAYVKNLSLKNVNLNGTWNVGAVIGYLSEGTVTNCSSSGSIIGESYIGGLIGAAFTNSTVDSSYSSVTVSVKDTHVYGGGLIGALDSSTVSSSYATGSVSPYSGSIYTIGGLIGRANTSSNISNSYASGTISGYQTIGGLIGEVLNSSSISNSYATGTITGYQFLGGLVGRISSSSTISTSYATGSITASPSTSSSDVGGLVGRLETSSTVSDSYASGNVEGEHYIGGLIGLIEAVLATTVSRSYSTGSVTGLGPSPDSIGGLIGFVNQATCNDSFSTGSVSSSVAATNSGRLFGQYTAGSNNCYFHSSSTCEADTSCTLSIGTAEPDLSDFYSQGNPPLSSWNFTSIWYERSNTFPSLR